MIVPESPHPTVHLPPTPSPSTLGEGRGEGLRRIAVHRLLRHLATPILFLPTLLILLSCSSNGPQQISSQEFYARHTSTGANPIAPLDQPGVIPSLPDAHAQSTTPVPIPRFPPTATPVTVGELPPISSIPTRFPSALGPPVPSTNPSPISSLETDQYMTLGGVVLVVNGNPIYADKVLRLASVALRKLARQMDRADFEEAARVEIERTIKNLTDDELAAAAAERSLDPKDIQLARQLTSLWAQHEVAEVGGAEQVARLRAQQFGESFEDEEQDQYHQWLYRLYLIRKIYPQVDITAEDERNYYASHLDEFTTPSQATIILVESDPDKLNGDDAAAKAKLEKIRARVLAGEDIAEYGRTDNDLPGATGDQGNGGQITIKPNSFVLTNVEDAVWKTPVGQISPVISDHDAYYIFKVVSRDQGGTKSFADRQVQDTITRHLRDLQIQQRRDEEMRKLQMEDIVQPTDPEQVDRNIDMVVDMAMQNYAQWSKQ